MGSSSLTINPPLVLRTAALVTGGARRVGRAVALRLAEAGMDVAITYHRHEAEAQQTAKQIEGLGCRAAVIRVDLAQPHAANVVYDQYVKHLDRLDALVNNASRFTRTPIGSIQPNDFDVELAVNARAALMLTQAFTPMLEANYNASDPSSTGRVVNFVDMHVTGQPLKAHAAYNASKAALLEITRTCAVELAPKITVNAIAPGVVEWASSYTPQQRAKYLQRVPLQRPGTPQEAADVVRFLVQDAHYCTGQVLRLDGGRWLT